MYFTFLVISYNHKDFIIQHLESIKFQIIHYGRDHDFQIIISDDCSNDNTVNYARQWLDFNSDLFKSIKILESNTNTGTCKNYIRGINNIEGEYFKALAGDDLYAKDNIFKAVDLLQKYDIVITPIGPFSGNQLFYDKKIYSRIFSMYQFVNTSYDKIRKNVILMPMTPGVFIKKQLLTDDVLNFVDRFKLIEDRSANIKLYEMNSNLNFGIYEKVLILYRYHANAITKTDNLRIANQIDNDDRMLDKYVAQNSSSLFVKLKNLYNFYLKNIGNRRIRLMLNIDVWLYILSFLIFYPKYRNSMRAIINSFYMQNEEHLNYLIAEAKRYEK